MIYDKGITVLVFVFATIMSSRWMYQPIRLASRVALRSSYHVGHCSLPEPRRLQAVGPVAVTGCRSYSLKTSGIDLLKPGWLPGVRRSLGVRLSSSASSGEESDATEPWRDLSHEQLKEMLASGDIFLVDVRESNELAETGKIDDRAVHIPREFPCRC